MKLSENFRLSEFTRSETATRMRIKNEPDTVQIENLRILVAKLLQPLREKFGKPFYINSGFRCTALNKAVNGSPTSGHMKGEAADVRVDEPRKLLALLLASGLEFDQAILYPTFLHLSYRSGNNRMQVLYAKGVKP